MNALAGSGRLDILARRAVGAVLLLALVIMLVATPSSDAAFTASSSNAGNSISAASSFTRDMASGTYAGNGTDNRQITGLGFQPDVVIVKAATAQGAVIRTRTMGGDQAKALFGATATQANRIESLLPNGFQLGTDPTVNSSGVTYYWWAATTITGSVSVGSYAGDGSATRAVGGLGYSPEAAIVVGANASAPVLRTADTGTSFQFDAGTGVASAVTALGADGFTLGNSSSTNANGVAYHWISFNDTAGTVATAAYTGNGNNNRGITGTGFQPGMVLVRSSSTANSRAGAWRPSALGGTNTLAFAATANFANGITALGTNGFTVGSSTSTNANGNPYAYLALANL